LAAVVIAKYGIGGRGGGGTSEEAAKAVPVEPTRGGDEIAGEADEVGVLGETGIEAHGKVGGAHAVGDMEIGDVEEALGVGDRQGNASAGELEPGRFDIVETVPGTSGSGQERQQESTSIHTLVYFELWSTCGLRFNATSRRRCS
jgi:hypothetical protein